MKLGRKNQPPDRPACTAQQEVTRAMLEELDHAALDTLMAHDWVHEDVLSRIQSEWRYIKRLRSFLTLQLVYEYSRSGRGGAVIPLADGASINVRILLEQLNPAIYAQLADVYPEQSTSPPESSGVQWPKFYLRMTDKLGAFSDQAAADSSVSAGTIRKTAWLTRQAALADMARPANAATVEQDLSPEQRELYQTLVKPYIADFVASEQMAMMLLQGQQQQTTMEPSNILLEAIQSLMQGLIR